MNAPDKTPKNWAAVFDVDGTMVDNAAYHEAAWIELGRRHGVPITAEYYRHHMHSRSNEVLVPQLFPERTSREAIDAVVEEKEALYRELYRPHVAPLPGLLDLIADLAREDVPVMAVTNSPPANAAFVLQALEIEETFRGCLDYTRVPEGKPAPDLYLEAARRLELPPGQCVAFEDSVSGFRSAEAAGVPYVAVTGAANPHELVHAQGALAHIEDFRGVTTEWIRRRAFGLFDPTD
ncbi:HAD family hydrolase [Kiritimatiella glycovorans]|uniref:Beta-phosphoglucomutase n=1 Tax=Kiritimatiella glycovorans TaxID=1307763 RepID=A0A0G3EHE4_9BACT|nr:HAD family phosphatase [Kiritimatiella glycovorans]AKJ63594.1 Beta-phosphoglucomutase [Kiritimatiella glycovorans]